mmetsp:Transcript_132448/g.197378  ORF Transcript_132448/g.197378 Transcript_132448/m.197378 type:complete len:240 (-) Transcript_132448:163-882(-)
MVPISLENWVPRPPMASTALVGNYVRIDPLDLENDDDLVLLWDALGGNDGTINDRLKWWGVEDFNCVEDLSNILQRIQEPEGCCVNVFRMLPSTEDNENNSSGVVAGMASYIATSAENGSTEVGYVAHGAAMARSPASTEAHYLLAKHAFENFGYRRLEWKCDSKNDPSNRAAIRYGYTFEGKFRQHRVTAKATNRDTNWYSIIDSEWPDRKQAMESWLQPCNFDENGQQIQKLESFQQ